MNDLVKANTAVMQLQLHLKSVSVRHCSRSHSGSTQALTVRFLVIANFAVLAAAWECLP